MSQASVLKIVQVTDLHLPKNEGQLKHGVSNDARWRAVLDHMVKHHDDLDLLVLTGDLADAGQPSAYTRLTQDLAKRLPHTELVWLPGNHDVLSRMRQADQEMSHAKGELTRSQWQKYGWQLLFLDSCAKPDGKGSGSLHPSSVDMLNHLQPSSLAPNVLLLMHHHPVPVGSDWQDAVMLGNAQAFWRILAQAKSTRAIDVKGIIFGHIHQVYRGEYQNVPLFGSPATAPQFKPGCASVVREEGEANQPAYSIYYLTPDGGVRADVEYVDA
ncbi:MAG: metallophosphoesterase [Pontibacterium sp.]